MSSMNIRLNVIKHNDRNYFEVKPSEQMLRSNLISDVVARGDRFGVDVETGKLTILPSEDKVAVRAAQSFAVKGPNNNITTKCDNVGALYTTLSNFNLKGYRTMTVQLLQGGKEVASVSSVGASFEGFLGKLEQTLKINGF